MKLGKYTLIIAAAAVALNAGAATYNTGYNTSVVGGQLVDNLWQVTATNNVPTGLGLPAIPYKAFVLPAATITWPWDTAQPVGKQNADLTQWISNFQPAFNGSDTGGMVTTYTLNFLANVGSYGIDFESDNYLGMYLGAVAPGNLFYADLPLNDASAFQDWRHSTVNITTAGLNQLNVVVYNFPFPTGNYTGLRVNFSPGAVPEPSSMALVAGGLLALVGAIKRRNSK